MNNIIFISMLKMWSMGEMTGAPSFYLTLKAYVENGYNVVLISPNTDDIKTYFSNDFTIVPIELKYEKLLNKKKIGTIFRLLRILNFERKAYRVAKKYVQRDSVLYGYEVHGIMPAKKIAKQNNCKLISRYQGTVISRESAQNSSFIKRLKMYPHFQALKTAADICIMTNDGTFGNDVLNHIGNMSKKILFLRNGIDFDKNRRKIFGDCFDKKQFKFLTVSRVVKWKRIDRAINLIKELVDLGYDCTLEIVGNGNEIENLKKLVDNLNLNKRVTFRGAVPHDQIYEIMQTADFFVSFYDLSNLGNPLFEAMYMGLPIITLDVGDTASVITDNVNGILIQPYDLKNAAIRIRPYLDNYSSAIDVGVSARQYALNNFYSWDERMKMEIDCVEMEINGNKKR